jgi:hypothetical protein
VILLHELFHGILQRKLGLAASEELNEHLDMMDGRYWLRLECRALARALRESGAQRNTAVRDALAFRQARRMRYQGSAEKERALEINEGVASYTGVAAAAESAAGAVTRAIEILAACDGDDSFVDSRMLQAEKGVLRESNGSVHRVPAPVRRDDTTLVGDGWTFTVKPGFVIREGPRRGDYEVVRQQP